MLNAVEPPELVSPGSVALVSPGSVEFVFPGSTLLVVPLAVPLEDVPETSHPDVIPVAPVGDVLKSFMDAVEFHAAAVVA